MRKPTNKSAILNQCRALQHAFQQGKLGDMRMPEDAHPDFLGDDETRLIYFTLPMSLNYQRNSYSLWLAATKSFEDKETKDIFSIHASATIPVEKLRAKLLKHKVALQPTKHTDTWRRLANTFSENWGSIQGFLDFCDNDFVKMREVVQTTKKKDFPYLSGPKIFHYWSYILGEYCQVKLRNRDQIEIAPDTHVIQASVRLGILTEKEALSLGRDEISGRWRALLLEQGISPIDMHSPLWFWSRNSFAFQVESKASKL